MRIVELAATCVVLLAGCGHDHNHDDGEQFICDGDEDVLAVGLDKSTAVFKAAVLAASPIPHNTDRNTLRIKLTDTADVAVEGATLRVVPFTAKHDHGTPVQAVVSDLGNGEYDITDINYVHHGPWFLHLDVTTASVTEERITFTFCIDEAPE